MKDYLEISAAPKTKISCIYIFGNSFTDGGTLANRKLIGFIGMDGSVSLKEWVPVNRLGNLHVRKEKDHFIYALVEKFIFDEMNNKCSLKNNLKQKQETLIIEWTGANDLITVNTYLPTKRKVTIEEMDVLKAIADKAIDARIANIMGLMENGYTNFALFNLPNLGLTPRFKGEAGEKNASDITEYFNIKLKERCELLQENCKNSNMLLIKVIDVNSKFEEIYENCEDYGFKPKNRNKVKSNDLSNSKNIIFNDGCMFNDDVHLSDKLHKIITEEAMVDLDETFNIVIPEKIEASKEALLLKDFKDLYKSKLEKDQQSFFGARSSFKNGIIYNKKNLGLTDILEHGLFQGGSRTREVIRELGWIDSNNNINPANLEVVKAYKNNWKRDNQNYTQGEIFFAVATLGFYVMLREVIGTDQHAVGKEMPYEDYAKAGILALGFILTAPIAAPLLLIMMAINSVFKLDNSEAITNRFFLDPPEDESSDSMLVSD